MRRPRLALACLLAVGILPAAGCGGSSSGDATTTSSSTTASAASGMTVEMTDDLRFAPKAITVSAGDTVTWTNPSDVTHNVKGDGFFSRVVEAGGMYRHRFATAGSFAYVCTFHPGMAGTVTVR